MEGKGRGCNRVEIPTSSFHLILFGLKVGGRAKAFAFLLVLQILKEELTQIMECSPNNLVIFPHSYSFTFLGTEVAHVHSILDSFTSWCFKCIQIFKSIKNVLKLNHVNKSYQTFVALFGYSIEDISLIQINLFNNYID